MTLFNSLGSNYNWKFVLRTLFSRGSTNSKNELTKFLENKYQGQVTLVYKGRHALELGLENLNLPMGSFVAIVGFTCFAVYEAIKNAKLDIEYLDVEKDTLNFSAETLQKALKKNPQIKVVIIQNTLGYPCEIEKISDICKEKKLILVEDLAHSIGTIYENGQEAGTFGDMTILSFSQDKMIDGISGGALITKKQTLSLHPKGVRTKKQVIDKLYPLFTYLIRTTYSSGVGKILHFILKKLNLLSGPMDGGEKIYHLPAWYCSLIKAQFEKLAENLNHRKKIAAIYATQINTQIISSKVSAAIDLSANLRFPIFVKNRERLIKYLARNQVFISDIWYDGPIAPKRYLAQTDYSGQCPNAETTSAQILNLPTHINITEIDAQNLSNLINQWLKSR